MYDWKKDVINRIEGEVNHEIGLYIKDLIESGEITPEQAEEKRKEVYNKLFTETFAVRIADEIGGILEENNFDDWVGTEIIAVEEEQESEN